MTAAQVEAILTEEGQLTESQAFDNKEKLIIRYAEELTRGTRAQSQTLASMRETAGWVPSAARALRPQQNIH